MKTNLNTFIQTLKAKNISKIISYAKGFPIVTDVASLAVEVETDGTIVLIDSVKPKYLSKKDGLLHSSAVFKLVPAEPQSKPATKEQSNNELDALKMELLELKVSLANKAKSGSKSGKK